MAESSQPEPSSPSNGGPIIFVSDQTDGGARLGTVLRTRGYSVADVRCEDLAERSASTPPSLIVCDADTPDVIASVSAAIRAAHLPPAVVALGEQGSLTGEQIRPLLDLGAEFFLRPVDTSAVLRRVEALLGAPSALPGGSLMPPGHRSGPPSAPTSSERPMRDGSDLPADGAPSGTNEASSPAPSHPSPTAAWDPSETPGSASRFPSSPPSLPPAVPLSEPVEAFPSSVPANAPSVPPPMSFGLGLDTDGDAVPRQIPQSQMSAELQTLLASAEMRVRDMKNSSSHPPGRLSPEAEVDALLPTEILAALDEPLEDGDDGESLGPGDQESGTGSESGRAGTGTGSARGTRGGTTGTGGRPSTATASRGTSPDSSSGSSTSADSRRASGTGARQRKGAAFEADTGAEPFATGHLPGDPAREAAGPPSASTHSQRPPSSRAPFSVGTRTGLDALPDSEPPSSPQHTVPQGRVRKPGTLPPVGAAAASDAPADVAPSSRPSPLPLLDARDDSQPPPTPVPGTFHETNRPGARAGRDTQHGGTMPPADRARAGSSPPAERPSEPPPPLSDPLDLSQPTPHPRSDSDEPLPRPGVISSLRPSPLPPSRDAASIPSPTSRPRATVSNNAVFTSPPAQPRSSRSGKSHASVAMPVPDRELPDEPFDRVERLAPAKQSEAGPTIPNSLRPGDAARAMATLVRSRYSGAIAFETREGIQRVVLRDGDFVTAASGVDSHSLTSFLVQRGALAPKMAESLSRRIPQFGRHAGAALIAHGHLRQDELWPVLRAHAEWLVGKTLQIEDGAASLEPEVPARLRSEPAVFGGATGAEVFVELVRRTLSPTSAIQRLGGTTTRFRDGPNPALLGECALPEHELAHVNRARSTGLQEALESASAPDLAAVLYALVELGVLERRVVEPGRRPTPDIPPPPDDIDDAARRARINARLALVEDGDYFAILGVGHEATAYDIRRAYTELRREFEPGQALTPGTADLGDEIETIVEVLDEAFDILRDQVRRDRYRRALEAAPR